MGEAQAFMFTVSRDCMEAYSWVTNVSTPRRSAVRKRALEKMEAKATPKRR